jgi:hypothetical protein
MYKCKQGYFCDGTCQNAVPEVLSLKDASWNGIPEPFVFGISITNTNPLHKILGHCLCSGTFFLKKNSPEGIIIPSTTYAELSNQNSKTDTNLKLGIMATGMLHSKILLGKLF